MEKTKERNSAPLRYKAIEKARSDCSGLFGTPSGARTLDTLIKSQAVFIVSCGGADVNCTLKHGAIWVGIDIRGDCIRGMAEKVLEAAHVRSVAEAGCGHGVSEAMQGDVRDA